jgi:alpha-beta hydrolase superfamily lysophospholipase
MDYILAHIKSIHPGIPVFLLGESMGGCQIINFVSRSDGCSEDIKGAILIAPGLAQDPFKLIGGSFLSRLSLTLLYKLAPGVPIIKLYNGDDEFQLKRYSARYLLEIFKYMKEASTSCYQNFKLPVIIFHGLQDNLIKVKDVQEFYNNIPGKDKELVLIQDGAHPLLNDNSFTDYFDKLVEFVLLKISPHSIRLLKNSS